MESTNRTREDRLQKETKSKSERSIRAMVQKGESNPMTTGVIASVRRNRRRSQCCERRCGKKKEKRKKGNKNWRTRESRERAETRPKERKKPTRKTDYIKF